MNMNMNHNLEFYTMGRLIADNPLKNDILCQIGSKVSITFTGKFTGTFFATIQRVTDKDILFMFDDCIAQYPMNKTPTNNGGFYQSALNHWLQDVILSSFPQEIRNRITEVSLPSYGMMFGHGNWYKKAIESDDDKQLPLMKKRRNRVADFNDDYEWYWLKNATNSSYSSATFAIVSYYGSANSRTASGAGGVRPVFLVNRFTDDLKIEG